MTDEVLAQHPELGSCAVIGVPDEVWGERVHTVVMRTPSSALTDDELRDFVGARIARFKAPRTVDFIGELPISPVGKILERTLLESFRS